MRPNGYTFHSPGPQAGAVPPFPVSAAALFSASRRRALAPGRRHRRRCPATGGKAGRPAAPGVPPVARVKQKGASRSGRRAALPRRATRPERRPAPGTAAAAGVARPPLFRARSKPKKRSADKGRAGPPAHTGRRKTPPPKAGVNRRPAGRQAFLICDYARIPFFVLDGAAPRRQEHGRRGLDTPATRGAQATPPAEGALVGGRRRRPSWGAGQALVGANKRKGRSPFFSAVPRIPDLPALGVVV